MKELAESDGSKVIKFDMECSPNVVENPESLCDRALGAGYFSKRVPIRRSP